MPTEGGVQMNLANIDCVGQDEHCKDKSNFANFHSELFFVVEKDLELIDIGSLFDVSKSAM